LKEKEEVCTQNSIKHFKVELKERIFRDEAIASWSNYQWLVEWRSMEVPLLFFWSHERRDLLKQRKRLRDGFLFCEGMKTSSDSSFLTQTPYRISLVSVVSMKMKEFPECINCV
jgi:hypothetical protein